MNSSRFFLVLTILFVSYNLFSQNYAPKVVHEFENQDKDTYLYNIPHHGPYGAYGCVIAINDLGNMVVYKVHPSNLLQVDLENYQIEFLAQLDIPNTDGAWLLCRSGEYSIFSDGWWFWGFNKNGEIKWFVKTTLLLPGLSERKQYITSMCFTNNILFFTDTKNNLFSVIHPGLDQDENKKNFRNDQQTKDMFDNVGSSNLKGLKLTADGNLLRWGKTIKDKTIFFQNAGDCGYFIDFLHFDVYYQDKYFAEINIPNCKQDEEFEGLPTVHPNGDIFYLRYDNKKNIHVLYRIENTWDPNAKLLWEINKKYVKNEIHAMVNKEGVRARFDSNVESDEMGLFHYGDEVQIIERTLKKTEVNSLTNYWYHVRRLSDGLEGWAFGEYLNIHEPKTENEK